MLTKTKGYSIIFLACETQQCASGSVVEHLLAKEGAAGSIPVSRFFFCKKMGTLIGIHFCCKIEPNPGLEGSMSRLPARSLLLLRRGVHWTPATRLALFFLKRYPLDTSFVILFLRRVSNPRGFDVSLAGSVVASASQRCPPDTRNPSRASFFALI